MSSDIYQRLKDRKAALDGGAKQRKPKNTGSHWRQYAPLAQSEGAQQPEPIMNTQETTKLCQRTPGCKRGHKHGGICSELTPEQRRQNQLDYQKKWREQNKPKLQADEAARYQKKKDIKTTANGHAPAVPEMISEPATALVLPEPTVTGFRFRLEIEEVFSDGEKTVYQTGGTSREKFKKVIDAAQALLNLEG